MIDPNAPAFPIPGMPPVGTGDPRDGMAGGCDPQPGITIRATMAKGFMSDYIQHLSRNHHILSQCYEEAASEACRMADALIAELNRTQP